MGFECLVGLWALDVWFSRNKRVDNREGAKIVHCNESHTQHQWIRNKCLKSPWMKTTNSKWQYIQLIFCTVTVTNEKQSIPRSLQQIVLQVLSLILYEHIFIHSQLKKNPFSSFLKIQLFLLNVCPTSVGNILIGHLYLRLLCPGNVMQGGMKI
jgi:hypothetical protein